MKLTTMTQVTVDGVMQGNGGSDPELDPGFERGGWAMPHFDEESATYVTEFCQRADAFLYGRRTYDLFARYWGTIEPGTIECHRKRLVVRPGRILQRCDCKTRHDSAFQLFCLSHVCPESDPKDAE